MEVDGMLKQLAQHLNFSIVEQLFRVCSTSADAMESRAISMS